MCPDPIYRIVDYCNSESARECSNANLDESRCQEKLLGIGMLNSRIMLFICQIVISDRTVNRHRWVSARILR